jgi:tetratricopeptide (TPR) repeat protein
MSADQLIGIAQTHDHRITPAGLATRGSNVAGNDRRGPGHLGSRRDEDPSPRPIRPARPRVEQPALPDDVEVDLPRPVIRELRQHIRNREVGDQVAVAMTMAAHAVEDDAPLEAVPYLDWAKQVAPRAPVIRETLAIAYYLAEDYKAALNELRAYRRLSASNDQDHLIADCLRATGRSTAEVAEVVEGMLAADAPADRCVEGLLVWAGAVADEGDLDAAGAVLRRASERLLAAAGEEAGERLAYVVADLHARAGDLDAAIAGFEQLAAMEDDPYSAGERLVELRARHGGSGSGTATG